MYTETLENKQPTRFHRLLKKHTMVLCRTVEGSPSSPITPLYCQCTHTSSKQTDPRPPTQPSRKPLVACNKAVARPRLLPQGTHTRRFLVELAGSKHIFVFFVDRLTNRDLAALPRSIPRQKKTLVVVPMSLWPNQPSAMTATTGRSGGQHAYRDKFTYVLTELHAADSTESPSQIAMSPASQKIEIHNTLELLRQLERDLRSFHAKTQQTQLDGELTQVQLHSHMEPLP
ncbi:unnamed protein product [Ectocarpus sp. 12 AP-2014]